MIEDVLVNPHKYKVHYQVIFCFLILGISFYPHNCNFRVIKMDNCGSGVVQVFVGEWSPEYEALSIKATKQTSSAEIVECIIERLGLVDTSVSNGYELAEVVGNSVGQECKERRLGPTECPVALMLLWPKNAAQQEYYRSLLRFYMITLLYA